MSSTPTDYDLDLKVAELKISGFTAFEDLVARRRSTAFGRPSCPGWIG